jgi:hypothetical protein
VKRKTSFCQAKDIKICKTKTQNTKHKEKQKMSAQENTTTNTTTTKKPAKTRDEVMTELAKRINSNYETTITLSIPVTEENAKLLHALYGDGTRQNTTNTFWANKIFADFSSRIEEAKTRKEEQDKNKETTGRVISLSSVNEAIKAIEKQYAQTKKLIDGMKKSGFGADIPPAFLLSLTQLEEKIAELKEKQKKAQEISDSADSLENEENEENTPIAPIPSNANEGKNFETFDPNEDDSE